MTALFIFYLLSVTTFTDGQGQVPLPEGLQPSIQPIKNSLGGVYSSNITLFFRNSPYRVQSDLTIEAGATLTIETGVQLYFDTGVGLKVKGAIRALGNEFAHIQMLPHQTMLNYDDSLPEFRLIDGPTVRQGRLQIRFRDRWRSVCTMLTNWTSVDTGTACKSMGYTDGGFWKWYRRNNDTYPFVMPKPDCLQTAKSLWECAGFGDVNSIPLSENLCQGEDDIGIYCWGPPTFTGWAKHWKGVQILSSPFIFVTSDPDMVSVHRESLSRLEYVDILYAGYSAETKNTTAALWIEGVPPIINGIRIERSARDGLLFYEPSGPILIANSTFINNRGHGIAIENTTDGRVFINMTLIEGNYGDGVHYRQKTGGIQLVNSNQARNARQISYYEEEKPRLEICTKHAIPESLFFPHFLQAFLPGGTVIDSNSPSPCWTIVSLPPRLAYTYTLQFINVQNLNSRDGRSKTELIVCDAEANLNRCGSERLRIPIIDGVLPQSVSLRSAGNPIFVSLEYGPVGVSDRIPHDINLQFRVHASVQDKAFYGLNITNSIIINNTGNGIFAQDIRERTVLTNVSVLENQGLAGMLVKDGAADIWLNASRFDANWGDGLNVSYAGGSITINGTSLSHNRWRGCAFHQNTSSPFLPLHQEIIFKGRPSNNIFYLQTLIAGNAWGGILVGNFCVPANTNILPKVIVSWIELVANRYHPSIEVHLCQSDRMAKTIVDITGNRIEGGFGIGLRVEPAVNTKAVISSNQFLSNNNTALLIRNARHPQLAHLPADVIISKNSFKFNTGQSIVSIGLNEDALGQKLVFNQQNEVRENTVINPFPHINPRSTPFAALVVSSSNVQIRRNCFKNPRALYEIATELSEHAKEIDARENNWGHPYPDAFMHRIFDQFNRYSLASIEVDPFAAVCNQRNPHITNVQQYFRSFRKDSEPFILGGTIWENQDLSAGRYTVTDDLNVIPGARLTISPGTILEFNNGVGMLVQGELIRADSRDSTTPVIFTSSPFQLPRLPQIRLVDENDNQEVTAGRLEVLVDGQWGTICNRSWSQDLALLACNQLGLIMDNESFENWRIFPSPGSLPMLMDNVRCEEREYDITQCRHDGASHNVASSCAATEVVGIRCAEPRWAGVRYSLLANPPVITGQATMNKWIIEKAGLFDFRIAQFTAALHIDWNYHTFHDLTVRDNFWNGVDIVYNDLTKKPAIRNSIFENNRRHGLKIRSPGITIQDVMVVDNGNAGFRYNPFVTATLQRDIVTWLERKEQPEMEANNVFVLPNRTITSVKVHESQLNHRKFLLFRSTPDCPLTLLDPCLYNCILEARGFEYGLSSKIAVQIVNRAGENSDEDIILTDQRQKKAWSIRKDAIQFPIVSAGSSLHLRYTRTYGEPKIVLLILFLDAQEYLDRFVHVYHSVISGNQYGISSIHYSNFSSPDGTVFNRWSEEKLWFQKVNFSRNNEAVLWVHSPQHIVLTGTPIAQIGYHIDNCSILNNTGSVIETHRDLYSSANVFRWNLWSNTFAQNENSVISIHLPDTYDLLSSFTHSFWMTENRFERNKNFGVCLSGYYAFANISSNNFTDNYARQEGGIITLEGMEKHLIIERNRFFSNWGLWVLKIEMKSQSLRGDVPAHIQYNYFHQNHFIRTIDDYVDMWPRSFAIGVFGSQFAEVHFNRFRNILLDFELISGCKTAAVSDRMNVTYNWWGVGNEAEISQRIFDFDDWNIFTLAEFSPFFVTEEQFIHFWWTPAKGQTANATISEPSIYDLKGRMFESKTLALNREKWHDFPFYYKPNRPYRIIKDLTIMPGATLTIEKGVEVHVWPNVRILVLGHLKAEGTYWEPIRFKPINATEYNEIRGKVSTRYRRWKVHRSRELASNIFNISRFKRRAEWIGKDIVYAQFPSLRRQDPFYQRFAVRLNGTKVGSGFLEMYNATTGEWVPSCDREFTIRNAQVVCRELGFSTTNAYHWLTPRWEYNPKIRILKTYVEPRECSGSEISLDRCRLRMNGNLSLWQCMDNEHFNYVHCGSGKILNNDYIGNWGGIAFAQGSLEFSQASGTDMSVMRHVEIVGGGLAHNDTINVGALLLVQRSLLIDNVNITNSSMDALQVICPREKVILNRLNITQNRGHGLSIWVSNLQGSGAGTSATRGDLAIPYNVRGMVEACSARKSFTVNSRLILYYKYDSYPVDCVKYFSAPGRGLAFRFLLVNLYNGSQVDLGRSDALSLYSDNAFGTLLHRFASYTEDFSLSVQSPSHLAIHLRASAADGVYGFIAEVLALPATLQSNPVQEVLIRQSRLENNDRGAVLYRNTGEIGPSVVIEECSINNNGYHLYGNISTSSQAVELHLHNTLYAQLLSTSISYNRGGLLLTSSTSSAVARLLILIRDSAFTYNSNSTAVAFLGNDYQKVLFMNNIVSQNFAAYYDTVVVKGMSVNFTRNLFANNTGLHTVDLQGFSPLSSNMQSFYSNWFHNNIALGHGHQYLERYGFQPEKLADEFARRPKRQVLNQRGVSFDWWTHVGFDSQRYRSTIFAGTPRQIYRRNAFNNPVNPYELTTASATNFDTASIDARENYWGYPGTIGVASGKIRDKSDYDYLIQVDYQPVLETNTSLIEGDCPAGWFQAGVDEFKSCFIYVGAALTYTAAIHFCQEMDAFLPYLRADDARQKELAKRVDEIAVMKSANAELFNAYPERFDKHFWISGVSVPSTHCGWMSSRTANIGTQNCNNLLSFVCERGVLPYKDPPLWREGIIIAAVALAILFAILLLLTLCWCRKSKKRKEEEMNRKEFIRASLRLSKMEKERRDRQIWDRNQTSLQGFPSVEPAEDAISEAHRNMIHGEKGAWSPTHTLMTSCSKSSIITSITDRSAFEKPATYTTKSTTDTFSRSNGSTSCSSTCPIVPLTKVPSRNFVLAAPDPYAEAAANLNTFGTPRKAVRLRDDPHHQTDVSTCTTATCSTCPTDYSENYTERDSTITEGSSWNDTSSARSSTLSDNTIVGQPLLSRGSQPQVIPPIVSNFMKSNNGHADYFKGSGRPTSVPFVPQARSNPALNAVPIGTPRPPLFSYSSHRTTLRPEVRPPSPPSGQFIQHAQPTRSLVDLVSPQYQSQRRYSTGRTAPIETSM